MHKLAWHCFSQLQSTFQNVMIRCHSCHSFGHILSCQSAVVHFFHFPQSWRHQKLGFVSCDWEFGMASFHTKSFVWNMQMVLSAVWFLHLPTLFYLIIPEFRAWLQISGSFFVCRCSTWVGLKSEDLLLIAFEKAAKYSTLLLPLTQKLKSYIFFRLCERQPWTLS